MRTKTSASEWESVSNADLTNLMIQDKKISYRRKVISTSSGIATW